MSTSARTLRPAPTTGEAATRPPELRALDRWSRLGRVRATVAAGGLAVLLGSTLVAAPAQAAVGVTSADVHRHVVARTGGQP